MSAIALIGADVERGSLSHSFITATMFSEIYLGTLSWVYPRWYSSIILIPVHKWSHFILKTTEK